MDYNTSDISVIRHKVKFNPDETKVITKFFEVDKVRIYKIFIRILDLPDEKIKMLLDQVIINFSNRHVNIKRIFKDNFERINNMLDITTYDDLSLEKKLLVGAYFTMEYSIESAALFNPSIVPHPNQNNLNKGQLRVIISFRAVGEGHMSSIVFQEGIVNKNGNIKMSPTSPLVEKAKIIPYVTHSKEKYTLKLKDLGSYKYIVEILDELLDEFTLKELDKSVERFKKLISPTEVNMSEIDRAIDALYWLVSSNYEIEFNDEYGVSQRVIFPKARTDIRAIEDARFVQFTEEDGITRYYGTYTAYNGFSILPQLIETKDFCRFKVSTLLGSGSQNKGIALFPEKINGKYVMVSRNDNENLFIMFSDNIQYWENPILLKEPEFYWEFMQIGNCGSPIKTEKGWVLLTHGVGPMRTYTIGAILLDLVDPTKVVGVVEDPILIPEENERNGYVPNVVYSCGAIQHDNILVLPYAVSDSRSGIATLNMDDLLALMKPVNE
jgi:beta-1,2-mannobiose phosphorylase / 1,2-beta-oligomannan phosphorylase